MGDTNNVILTSNCNRKQVDILTSDYQLDRDKAMLKKIIASDRTDIKYEVTGGGHRISLNAGLYEAVKLALPDFYEKHPDYSANIPRLHVEDSGCVVDLTMTIHNRTSSRKVFTINLYNTTSRILVNGQSPNIFRRHLDQIRSDIKDSDISKVNKLLKSTQLDKNSHADIPEPSEPRRSSRQRKPTEKVVELEDNKQSRANKNSSAARTTTDQNTNTGTSLAIMDTPVSNNDANVITTSIAHSEMDTTADTAANTATSNVADTS